MNIKHQAIQAFLARAMADPYTVERVRADYRKTLACTGLATCTVNSHVETMLQKLADSSSLDDKERVIHALFKRTRIGDAGIDMCQALDKAMVGRSEIIYDQISPHLKGITGPVIDFGCGNCKVAEFLHEHDGLDMTGYDVVGYQMPGIVIPFHLFDGEHVPVEDGFFEAGVLTNVAHHELDNEKILRELTRIVRRRLVIIETVPVGATAEEVEHDRLRTFMNDFLYNRLFCYGADIPTPGTYETPQGWIDRFQAHGWRVVMSQDLGVDQAVIEDTHHLLVLEK